MQVSAVASAFDVGPGELQVICWAWFVPFKNQELRLSIPLALVLPNRPPDSVHVRLAAPRATLHAAYVYSAVIDWGETINTGAGGPLRMSWRGRVRGQWTVHLLSPRSLQQESLLSRGEGDQRGACGMQPCRSNHVIAVTGSEDVHGHGDIVGLCLWLCKEVKKSFLDLGLASVYATLKLLLETICIKAIL